MNAGVDPDAELVPEAASAALRQRWPALVDRIRHAVGDVETDESFPHLDLATVSPRVRLELADNSASISVPYWYLGDDAQTAVMAAYRIASLVETETGLQGIDGQTGSAPSAEAVGEAIASYTSMSSRTDRLRRDGGLASQ